MANELASYVLAADSNNVLNTGTSWTDPESYTNALGNAGKFIATSLLSGANSFYNSAAAVGNWAGLDTQQNDTQKWITSLDGDWGKYYRANKELVDTAGFVAGAIIPGLAGAKLLNIGQNVLRGAITDGVITGNLARATGLLVTGKAQYLAESGNLIRASLTSSSIMNAKTYGALASGVYQNALEAMAGEILITATMFKSPTMEDLTIGGVVHNTLVSGALGGVIGGAFEAAKSVGFLKKLQDKVDLERLPWTQRATYTTGTPHADRAIQTAYNLESLAFPVLAQNADETARVTFQTTSKLYQQNVNNSLNEIRTALNDMAGSDSTIANMLADLSTPVRNADGSIQAGFSQRMYEGLTGAAKLSPVGKLTSLESQAAKIAKMGGSDPNPIAVRFIQLHGDEVGKITEEMPKLPSLADVHETPERIMASVRAEKFSIKQPFDMSALTNERDYLVAERRMLWAASPKHLKEIPEGALIHATDIPVLTRAYDDGVTNIKIVKGSGPSLEVVTPGSKAELLDIIRESKVDLANEIHLKTAYKGLKDPDISADAAARIADVKRSYLEGTHQADELRDLFASKSNYQDHLARLQARGLSTSEAEAINPLLLPRTAKIVYQLDRNLLDTNESVVDAMVHYRQQQQLLVEGNRRVTAKHLGDTFAQLPDYTERELARVNRREPGAGLLTGANSGYGSPGQVSTQIGKVTQTVTQQRVKDVSDSLAAPLVRLGAKPEAAFEFEAINQKLGRSDALFVRATNTLGEEGLVDISIARPKGVPQAEWPTQVDYELLHDKNWIPVKHQETLDAIGAHTELSSKRTGMYNEIRAAQGYENMRQLGVVRPIRPDPKDYPYFAFVYDPRVNNSGHVAMIHAASEKELAGLIDKVPAEFKTLVDPDGPMGKITVRTKGEIEAYKQARGDYEFQRTLHENYINSELASKGVYSNYFPKSDPQKIINDVLQQHTREERTAVRELIRLHYEPEFAMFEDMGKGLSQYSTSRFASSAEQIERTSNNPYFNHIKTALNISNISEHNLVYGFNKMLDSAASKAYGALQGAWRSVTSEADLKTINALLDQQGMKPAYYDSALQALANHTAPKGVLTEFVSKANSMLSLFTLGLDPLNAVTNAIGANVLRGTETQSILRAIREGNTELAGELSQLGKIKLPGVEAEMISHKKLVANAISNLFQDGANGPLKARYKGMGLIKDRMEQLSLLIDDFTLTGTESVSALKAKQASGFGRVQEALKSGALQGEKWSGNKFAEEANRFISANVMDQLTGLAVKHGLMDDRTAQAYINTFVNRVEGTIVASQRPLVFQGPIGQAVGLFQRYQFNLLQQLFRYVGEGTGKDVAMMMGLQGSIFGLQGLPAFQFINTHVVGQLSGNTEHRDLYDFTYGLAGKTAADFMLYGAPSNILQANIYTRGDINPRHLTLLPTTLQETPLVQGWGKFLGNIWETMGKIGAGGNVAETLIQGMEHNGISRPLAGFAQVFQGFGEGGKAYSTSNQGSIVYSNDLVSWASMVRLAGGRPLDEARTNDAMWRVQAYQAGRKEEMKKLGEVVKTTLIQGNNPTAEDIGRFAEKYARLGGKQEHFNKWMMGAYKDANISQAQQLEMNLKHPFNQKVQLLMGGDLPD